MEREESRKGATNWPAPLWSLMWTGLSLKTSPYVQGGKGKRISQGEKNMKRWGSGGKRWEQEPWLPVIRTPLCRNPTACHWIGKQKHAFEKSKKRGQKIHTHTHTNNEEWDLAEPGSQDKPNGETQGLFWISTGCLDPSTFPVSPPPSTLQLGLLFPHCFSPLFAFSSLGVGWISKHYWASLEAWSRISLASLVPSMQQPPF